MLTLIVLMLLAGPAPAAARPIDQPAEQSREAAVRGYLDRIAAIDRQGPTLRAVIATNPDALAQARASDARRKQGRPLGPLDGMAVLVKDNIETADPMPTTAGSLALKDNLTRRDAGAVAALRRAGVVVLGKTNLSEWANMRSPRAVSGWSAVGGLTRNPHALDRTACGSSSGSAVAVAAGMAAGAIGTETDGSIICPAATNGVVGLKPTRGLVSRSHVVPISHSLDTPGPIARSVRDVALLLSAMVASDPADPATMGADRHRRDYAAGLSPDALKGVRVAVLRPEMPPEHRVVYERALAVLAAAGAVLVDVARPALEGLDEAEGLVLRTEFRVDLNAYLATTPAAVKTRTLDQLIAFNRTHAAAEMPLFGQEVFEQAATTRGLDEAAYRAALVKVRQLAGPEGIDAMLATARATLLVTPSNGAAWRSDPTTGETFRGPSFSSLPAVAGYPHLTVPMGLVGCLPVGLSFIAAAYGDAAVLGAGHAFEQRAGVSVKPRYLPSVTGDSGLEGAGR